MTTDSVRAIMAPLAAFVILVGGGAFLYLTIGVPDAEETRLIVSGLMGGAATFLFGDAAQRRAQEGLPVITASPGPPPEVTVTPSEDAEIRG